ncbi:MAG TPA: SRPBCC domain-containing protein [Anaerolineales bacterium]|nr:SRPBCC domain-containing protein [Anaerolineales bacterium]
MTDEIRIEQFVKASPAQIYYSLTHAVGMTEWLCDFATLAPRPGGRIYLWWHGDFYTAGEFIGLEENRSVAFHWRSGADPAPSTVTISLAGKDGGTLVTLAHTVPAGEEWSKRAEGFRQEWAATLGNLAQVMETGLDKRTFERPMLGINLSDFTPDIAKAMGVPVTTGMRLDFLPEEMGAFKAGLRKDDVLVELAGKPLTSDFGTLLTALQGKKGGDKVEVVFYRGPEKKTLTMELSRRPIPQIPWDAAGLAKEARKRYNEGIGALEKIFAGVSESEADFRPAPSEWNAKEVLAHLIQNERHWLENLDDVIGGYPRVSDDWGGNSTIHARATAGAYKTVRGLLDEEKRLADEMVAYVEAFPPEFVARKASYFQAANMLLEGSLPHILSHTDQIKAAIEAARKPA